MGNEMSRSDNVSPQDSGVVPSRSPYTPTSGASRHAKQCCTTRSPSPSLGARASSSPQDRPSSSSPLPRARPFVNPKKERTIQRMDKAIRRRVRGGITYNMKLLIRGAKGTGKTSLFQRLKGEPIPETHDSTSELQAATINWKFRQHLEENIKCDVWDVVDRAFVPLKKAENDGVEGPTRLDNAANQVDQIGLQQQSLPGGGTATSAMQNGTHSMALVDASTVDVYYEAHGVIFLLDITKWETLEYVKQQLDNVPVHIPTLVLGNFRDQGAQRKIFKEDIQKMLYGTSDRPPQQQWRRPTELLYFECSLLNCFGLKSLHQYLGIPFLQLKLATIRQQMHIVEGEFTYLKRDVQATIVEQRYVEYVEHIKTTGSDIRTGRSSSGSGCTTSAVSCNNSAISSFNDIDQENLATKQDNADNGSEENGAGTRAIALTTSTQQEQEVTESQEMEELPAINSDTVIQATPPLKVQQKESMASIPDDATDSNVSNIEGKHAIPNEKNSESPLVSPASPRCPRKALKMEEVIHLEDFQVPKTRTSDLDHFYSEDESDDDNSGNDEDVVVAPADGPMKVSVSSAGHKQRFLDSDSSDSDESESTEVQRRRNEKAPQKSSPHRRAAKQADATTDQTILPSHQSSLPPSSPDLPPTVPPSMPKSRLGSPARSQPIGPIKDSQGVPRGELQKQHHSCGQTREVARTLAHAAAPPTSASVSLARQSSPRSEKDHIAAATSPEPRVSVLQVGHELKNESFSRGTETATSMCGKESPPRLVARESLKNLSCGSCSSANNANENAATSHAPEENETSASLTSMRDAVDNNSNSEPLSNLTQKNDSIKKEIIAGSADAGMNELSVDKPDTILAQKVKHMHSAAAASQETEGADMPHDLIASRPPQCHHQERISKDESDGCTSDSIGPTRLPLSSLKEALSIPVLSAPSTVPMLSNTEGVRIVTSRNQDDTMGHYHPRNLYEAGDFFSLSALQASLPLPDEAALPLPSILHECTKAPIGCSNGVRDFETNATSRLPGLQTISLEALASKPVVSGFTTVVSSNDLEAFLNESGSDLENGAPSNDIDLAGGNKQSAKERRINKSVMVESDDDGDEEGNQDRFASYSISRKNRSKWRRQQKEDLLKLNAVLNMENGSSTPSASAVAATDSSFVAPGVMEAIRTAEEAAMRMLPTDLVPIVVGAESSVSKKRHIHKHKEHKKR